MVCLYHVYNSQSVRLLSMQIVAEMISSEVISQNTELIPFVYFHTGIFPRHRAVTNLHRGEQLWKRDTVH